MWIFSMLLLQERVEDQVKGCVFALEQALYTMGSITSLLVAGALTGGSSVSMQWLAGGLGVIAAVMAVRAECNRGRWHCALPQSCCWLVASCSDVSWRGKASVLLPRKLLRCW
jgi:hypothetical protein